MLETRQAALPQPMNRLRAAGLTAWQADALTAVFLVFVMLTGGYARFMSNNWDDFVHFHPDERYFTQVASALGGSIFALSQSHPELYAECLERYPDTNGQGAFFDANCSPYNPENVTLSQYLYGTLPLFIAYRTAHVWADYTGDSVWVTYDGVHLVWRALSAGAETLVILLVFLIASRLHGRRVGLLAAVLYAGTVFSIQLSHFATMEAMTNFFVALALYFAIRAQDSGRWWDYLGFGVALGLTVSGRVNLAPLAAVIAVVALVRVLPAFDARIAWRERSQLFSSGFTGVLIAAVASLIVFRVANPYAFTGPSIFGIFPNERFIEGLGQARYQVSGEMEIPPNWQWINRIPYLFSWQNIVLWGMGIALGLTAWLGWAVSLWRVVLGRAGGLRNIALTAWIAGYFAFAGGLWVMSMRYYLPLYPALTILAAWLLVEWWDQAAKTRRPQLWRPVAGALLIGVVGFTTLWALMFTNIYRNLSTFNQSAYWVWENVSADFSMRIDNSDAPLINLPLWNAFSPGTEAFEETFLYQATRLEPGSPVSVAFTAPVDGVVSSVQAHRIVGVSVGIDATASRLQIVYDDTPRTVRVRVSEANSLVPLTEATLTASFARGDHPLGQGHEFRFDSPLPLRAGQGYLFTVEVVAGGTIATSGAVMVNEAWDEPLPPKACSLPVGMTLADSPPPGMFTAAECNGRDLWGAYLHGGTLDLHWEDELIKRERLQVMLDQTDYIVVGTNRRYDSNTRNPARWPLTTRYYEVLFNGELGFELAAMFQETFEFGPFRVSDQHLPIYDSPRWLNEFEAEEAFHVYDHPVVFVFRKTERYTPQNTQAVLGSVPLARVGSVFGGYNDPTVTQVMTLSSLEVSQAPTLLEFTDPMREMQTAGGTWSERFNRNSLLNQNQVAAVIFWWALLIFIGWSVWPLLFFAFPALADRGYAVSKAFGMLLIAWIAWVAATLRFPLWSPAGLWMILILLALISGWLAWRNRAVFREYIALRWRYMVGVEVLMLMLFVALIGVRLTNPDLWHQTFGGEKPMDFAYFNGVLRSSIFPAIDPWFADGYLNYYYFGFVIVGVPTLLLGMVPSLAYNLIIPMLFSMTGIGAFAVAFNIASGFRRVPDESPDESLNEPAFAPRSARPLPVGNPWVAGIAALLLAVILGNLDTVRVFGNGIAALGGYQQPISLGNFLIRDFIESEGREPDEAELNELLMRGRADNLPDRVRYEIDNTVSLIGGVAKGFGEFLGGAELYISPERWFWGPTRVIAEIPNSGDGAIHEMPFFTFLYADLHAHMIAMPMMMFALLFVYHELMAAGRDKRRWLAQSGGIAFGGLTIGLFYATNTWDYPTFMILGTLGLGYAWWLRWQVFHRRALLDMLIRIGGFLIVTWLVSLPFRHWFASGLTEFKLWEGNKTPLWAYFDIHGLFLFLIVSLLIWETHRWLRAERVMSLRGKGIWLGLIAAAMFGIMAAGLALALLSYQVALIALPLIGWIALLFFRRGQTRSMQYVLVLAGLALAITLGTEIITLANDNGRQNTVFKFYLQAWLMFSIIGGLAFSWLIGDSLRWRTALAFPWYSVLALLVMIAALYPIMATRGKAEFRMTPEVPLTLDGAAFMRYATHWEGGLTDAVPLIDDYNAIRWLQDNVQGSPVIMEAQSDGSLYKWGGRISIHTGLPSVLGWDHHQRQQRSLNPMPLMVNQRGANVNNFYTTPSISDALNLLRVYDVRYVVMTSYEVSRYRNSGGLAKFETMVERGILRVAYQEGGALIYEVDPDRVYAEWVAYYLTQAGG